MSKINPAALQTTEELRHWADRFQEWDDYPTDIFALIRNPKCDRGTALLVFWLNDPVSFFELYANEEEAGAAGDWCRNWYQFLVELQSKYIAGFYVESDFYVDPEKEAVGELTSENLKTPIAEIMRKPSL